MPHKYLSKSIGTVKYIKSINNFDVKVPLKNHDFNVQRKWVFIGIIILFILILGYQTSEWALSAFDSV